MHYNDYPMMNGYDAGWGFIMMLLWLAFFIGIAFVVVRLLKGNYTTPHRRADPLDIVKERYAKGEITKEEFEQIKKDLK